MNGARPVPISGPDDERPAPDRSRRTATIYRRTRVEVLDYFGPVLSYNSAATVSHLYR